MKLNFKNVSGRSFYCFLNLFQYGAIMALIKELMDKVEEEHRAKLEQLNTIQSEQRYF